MIIKLSPSSLNLLEDCPRCFWLQIIKKVTRPSGPFPSLPSGMDKKIKEHFDKFRDNNKLPPELNHHKVDAVLFNDKELLKTWRNNFSGISYTDSNSGILLHGAVDDILEKDGKLIVLDFKTRGFDLKEDTAHHYKDQLNVYNFLLRKNGHETEDYAYLLFYMPDKILETGEFLFKTELVKMDINISHAEALFNKAVKVLNDEIPNADKDCEYCKLKDGI